MLSEEELTVLELNIKAKSSDIPNPELLLALVHGAKKAIKYEKALKEIASNGDGVNCDECLDLDRCETDVAFGCNSPGIAKEALKEEGDQ